jgi:RNA polymerase sigma-70 factor (ECF subfamily)
VQIVLLRGKEQTFETVVRAHAAALYRFAFWLCRDRQLVEDLVQQSLSRAWQSWSSLRDVEHAREWLLAICRNENARAWRNRTRAGNREAKVADGATPNDVERIAGDMDLRRALEAMPLAYSEPLLLQVLGGFTCAEIAELLGTTEGAIMTRLSRARQDLRRRCEQAPVHPRSREGQCR